MSDLYRELLVKRQTPMKDRILQGAMILVTAVCAAAGILFQPLLLLGALALGIACYFVFPGFDLEYEYLYVNGELDIDKIMARKKRKQCAAYHMENLELLAPAQSHALDEYRKNKTMTVKDFTSQVPETPYYVMIISQDKGMEQVKLELDEGIVQEIRRIAPRKVSQI